MAENKALKQELMFISAQNEIVYTGIAKLIAKLQEEIAGLKKQVSYLAIPICHVPILHRNADFVTVHSFVKCLKNSLVLLRRNIKRI